MGDIYESVREHTTKIFAAISGYLTSLMRRQRIQDREIIFALHSFTPARGHTDQLSFTEGDEFVLKSDADQKWWHAKHIRSGKKGYVPMSYVARRSELQHMEWYDMRISRDDAIQILSKEKYKAGSFIIRTTDKRHFSHALAMSVKTDNGDETSILHYVINRENGEFRIDGGKKFPTLIQLVQYYAGHHSGLKQPLTFSVKKDKLIDVWEIDPNDVIFNREDPACLLGTGYFGAVYKGTLSGHEVAVKTTKEGRMTVENFMREAAIARDFSHANIVKTLGVCSSEPYIITEFLSGGNLKSYVEKNRVAAKEFFPIAQKIACAMSHLEEKDIIHRDLAARNILVGATLETIKLADFGLARCLEDADYYSTDNGQFPYKWTAPEAFQIKDAKQKGKFTTASDVWSFAVVLWEMYSKGAEPYGDLHWREIYDKISEDNYRLPCTTGCPPVIYEKMLECWALNPTQRPTFAHLNEFFRDPYALFTTIVQIFKKRRREVKQREILFALHSSAPANGDTNQLSFAEGDEFILYSDADAEWWHVKHEITGNKGYVPSSYVVRKSELQHMEWYDLTMTREDANRILGNANYPSGSFIIRTNKQHFSRELAMAVKTNDGHENRILHYVISRKDDTFKIKDTGKAFPSLTRLVQYYSGHFSEMRQSLVFSVKKNKLLDFWEIDPEDVIVDMEDENCLLETGFFAEIYKGTFLGHEVAVRTLKTGRMTAEQFLREASIARQLSHKNIVNAIGVCSEKPCIVMEYLPGGNLKDYIRKRNVPRHDYLLIAQKIASAMAHLEERGIVHRDLAARNILVGETHDVIKLSDFLLARELDDSGYYKTNSKGFPYKWTAPEAFVLDGEYEQKTGKSTTASDVWSFGVLLWELYSNGAEPYEGYTWSQIYTRLVEDNFRLACPTGCAPVIYEKMIECWNIDPAQRPTFAELVDFLADPYGAAQ